MPAPVRPKSFLILLIWSEFERLQSSTLLYSTFSASFPRLVYSAKGAHWPYSWHSSLRMPSNLSTIFFPVRSTLRILLGHFFWEPAKPYSWATSAIQPLKSICCCSVILPPASSSFCKLSGSSASKPLSLHILMRLRRIVASTEFGLKTSVTSRNHSPQAES